MKICIPIANDNGLDAPVYSHLGSAPYLAIFDQDAAELKIMPNENQHHGHGACRPADLLKKQDVNVLITGGIGRRAFAMINKTGVKVYRGLDGDNVRDAIEHFQKEELKEVNLDDACGRHHGQGGCH